MRSLLASHPELRTACGRSKYGSEPSEVHYFANPNPDPNPNDNPNPNPNDNPNPNANDNPNPNPNDNPNPSPNPNPNQVHYFDRLTQPEVLDHIRNGSSGR